MSNYGKSRDPRQGRPTRPPRRPYTPEPDPYADPEVDPYDPNQDRYDRYERRPSAPSPRGGISWQDILFVGLLVLAAIRGANRNEGCTPGKGCQRVASLVVAGGALLISAAYLSQTNQTVIPDNVLGVMACAGSVLCVASGGVLVFALFGLLRIINLDISPDDAARQASGLFGNLFGQR